MAKVAVPQESPEFGSMAWLGSEGDRPATVVTRVRTVMPITGGTPIDKGNGRGSADSSAFYEKAAGSSDPTALG